MAKKNKIIIIYLFGFNINKNYAMKRLLRADFGKKFIVRACLMILIRPRESRRYIFLSRGEGEEI